MASGATRCYQVTAKQEREEHSMNADTERLRATTIVAVRRGNTAALAGDGQVSLGQTILKSGASKVRPLAGGRVLAGFAGTAGDAFTLLERLEAKLEQYAYGLQRAAIELMKEWRTERAMQRLEAMLIAMDREHTLLLTGSGEVLSPDEGVVAIGSGGSYALAAARAMVAHTALSSGEIAREALEIAADICVYTNHHITVEEMNLEESQT